MTFSPFLHLTTRRAIARHARTARLKRKAHPEVFANKSVGDVADHFEDVIRGLKKKPAIIGHSFGGLLQMPDESSRIKG